MASLNKNITLRDEFDAKYSKTAPLKWCPKCGAKLIESQVSFASGKKVISGKMCKTCGYIHEQVVK